MNMQGRLFNTIARLLIAVMWAQPLHGIADSLQVDQRGGSNTQIITAGNGVPVVNIATASDKGLSHNKFTDYNVGKQGVILNNSTDKLTSTRLGGIILGNSQLKGKAANTILNEVTGGQRSRLKGYTEVAGKQAHVIVANPHGITCDGCGFINTPHATLTTGKPVLDQGRLHGYDVDGGDIEIAGAGLNASNISRFDLITRSTKINAGLHANELNIITGRNQVDAKTLAASTKQETGDKKPQLAIDSSALGGMYAGAIRLVGTEAGVGVKLAGDMAASAGDIQIDANGKLTLARVLAEQDIRIHSTAEAELPRQLFAGNKVKISADTLNNRDALLAGQSVSVSARQVRNQGLIEAGIRTGAGRSETGDVRAQSAELSNLGTITASRALQIETTEKLDNRSGQLVSAGELTVTTDRLDNRQGLVRAAADLQVKARMVDNSQQGAMVAGKSLTVLADKKLNNSQGGAVVSNDQLVISARSIENHNQGLLSGRTAVAITAESLDNRDSGTLSSQQGHLQLQASGQLDNSRQGALVSGQSLKVQAGHLNNSQGIVSAVADVTVSLTGQLDNSRGQITATTVSLSAAQLDNTAGEISAQQMLTLSGLQRLLNQQAGQVGSGGGLLLQAASIENRNSLIASEGWLSLFAQQVRNTDKGSIVANDRLLVQAGLAENHGRGQIHSRLAEVILETDALDNAGGLIQSHTDLNITARDNLGNQAGSLLSEQGTVTVQAHDLDNREGILASLLGHLKASIQGLFDNQSGTVQGQTVELQADELANRQGHVAALAGSLALSAGTLGNQGGGLYAQQQLTLAGGKLDNSEQGQIAGRQIDFSLTGKLDNQSGLIEADRLQLLAGSLHNRQGQLRVLAPSRESHILVAGALENSDGRIEVASQDFSLNAAVLLNRSGQILHAGRGEFDLFGGHARQMDGTVISRGRISLSGDRWENSARLEANTLDLNVGHFTQTSNGQLVAGQSLTARGDTWINHGLIASDGNLGLDLSNGYNGSGQLVSLGDLQLAMPQLMLETQGLVYGAGQTRIEGRQLTNLGSITPAGNLSIEVQQLTNRGTLGSAGLLDIRAAGLINEDGLIFSGADMQLRVGQLINRHADIYSLGNIDLGGRDSGTPAQRVDNISASMEALGDFTLRSVLVENRRDILAVRQSGKYSVVISELPCNGPYRLGDCNLRDNGRRNAAWQVTEREKLEVVASSAASLLQAGGSLSVHGEILLNSSSQISSGENLILTVSELANIGVKPVDSVTQRVFISGRKPTYYYYNDLASSFNTRHVPQVQQNRVEQDLSYFISRMEREYLPGRQTIETPLAGEDYSAIIQAAGNVTIEASQSLENSIIRPGYTYIGGGNRINVREPGNSHATEVRINAQLPPDLQHRQVDPSTLPDFALPEGDKGLFRLTDGNVQGPPAAGSFPSGNAEQLLAELQRLHGQNNSHAYLVETNPALTQLHQFLSSDYLLGNLGLSPDNMQKRLGDGLYEQKLLREALIARTGQRFIDGLNSDEALFRYLMDNAVASKEALNLSVGISLSAEQVAALTHDIVWMEEREVLGEQVLVPVLYLAQAEGRLAANGALVQGQGLSLISGGDLSNQGVLRATSNLAMQAQNIYNSGLLQAGEHIGLLAEDSLYNRQGGILAARDIDIAARTGDILNERSITRHESALGGSYWETSFADNAARIEAANSLSLNAGRDVRNLGGVLQSGAEMQVSAGNDVVLSSVEERHGISRGSHYLNSQTAQLISETVAGGKLAIQAGHDLTAVASRIGAGQDMQLAAGNDLTLASAANESHHYSKSKKRTNQRDLIQQQGTEVISGGSLVAVSGNDLTLISSSMAANDEAYLVAGGKVQLWAEQDVDYRFAEKKKKGSFGRKSYRMSESDSSTAAVSSIQASADLLIHGDEAIVSQGTQLRAGQHLELQSGGDILLLAAENSSSQASAKSKSGLVSSKGKTSSQSQTQVVGTTADAGSILVAAERDLLVRSGDLRAQDDIALQAGRDVELSSAIQSSSQSQSKHSSKLGFNHHALLTHTQKQQAAEQGSGTAVGSHLSADNLLISGGRDTRIQGSTLISERDMHIRAGRNLEIVSAENTSQNATSSSSKKAGEIGKWWQPSVGRMKQKVKTQGETLQQSGSQLASLAGNVHLQAGETYQQTASDVLALEGDIHIQGQQVNIEAGHDQLSHSETRSANRTAVGGTVSIPVVNAILGMQQVNKARERTDDPRMQALAAATLAMQGKAAYDSAQTLYNGNVGGIKISLNLSNNNSKSQRTQQGQNVSASSVIAGGDIHVRATGAQDSDLNIIGSRLSAGRDISLAADRNILLRAAENTAVQSSKNSGSGWSAGIGFGLGGSQSGFTLELAANQFRGKSDGNDSLWSNTRVEAGRQVHLESGADTRLQGAVVKGEQVSAEVGGNLLLESLQDRSTYRSRQSSSSAGVSLCIPPFCAGTSTASASQSNSKARGDYASVNQQSGLQAGDGGFQLKVKGRTDLTGAVIASSEQAARDGLNRLETGALRVRDVENHSDYKASSSGLVASIGFGVGEANKEAMAQTNQDKSYRPDLTGSAVSKISGSDSSVTRSGISQADIVITDWQAQQELTGQTATALLDTLNDAVRAGDSPGGIGKNWDGKKLERVVQANAEIMTAFSQQAGHAVSAYVQNRREELLEQKRSVDSTAAQEEIQGQINALNTQERVVKTVIGALTGQLDTAVAHAVLQEAADQMRQYSIESSSRFAGVIVGEDEQGNPLVLSNISGDSAGVRGDGIKLGGVRVDLDLICGEANQRCVALKGENDQDILDSRGIPLLKLENGMVQYDARKAKMPFDDFLLTKDGKKMSGLTGGVQGLEGTMADKPYAPNSFWDHLVESFAGTHDTIGGSLSGLYDEQGNTVRKLTKKQKMVYDAWSVIAIAPSAPFAMSEALPSEAWQVLEILLKGN